MAGLAVCAGGTVQAAVLADTAGIIVQPEPRLAQVAVVGIGAVDALLNAGGAALAARTVGLDEESKGTLQALSGVRARNAVAHWGFAELADSPIQVKPHIAECAD